MSQPTLGFGDAITLVTAFFFGIWFVQTGAWANRFDVVTLTCVELLTLAALAVPFVALDGLGHFTAGGVRSRVHGLGCRRSLTIRCGRSGGSSPRASMINLLEPVVAGFIGYAVGSDWGGAGISGP
jgi:hypothetical protein